MHSRWLRLTMGLLVGSTLLLVAAACGADEPTPTSPPPTATAVPEPTATPTPLPPGVTPPPPTATPVPAPDPTATPIPSFDAAEYFKGKTIVLVANSSPGGGTDSQGRVMAAFIGQWIPGNPRVVFSNRPRAGIADRHRDRIDSLHQRHDGSSQGGEADPSQPDGQCSGPA